MRKNRIVYYPQRGGFDESVKDKRIFKNIYELLLFLVVKHEFNYNFSDIVLAFSHFDCRLNKPVFSICIKKWGLEKYEYPQRIGTCVFEVSI